MHKYTHIGRLFYLDADIPSDVQEVTMSVWDNKVRETRDATAKKLFWRFYLLTSTDKPTEDYKE